MQDPKYIRIHYSLEFSVIDYIVTWFISGPLRLLDGLLTTIFLGVTKSKLSGKAFDSFHIYKLTKELQLEEKLNS